MTTFPIGMTPEEDESKEAWPRLPITAAFWGPASSEPIMIQAAIDFQAHFPEYHNEVPPDPTPEIMRQCFRPADTPRVWPINPHDIDGLDLGEIASKSP